MPSIETKRLGLILSFNPTHSRKHQSVDSPKVLTSKGFICECWDHSKHTTNTPIQGTHPDHKHPFPSHFGEVKCSDKHTEQTQHGSHGLLVAKSVHHTTPERTTETIAYRRDRSY